MSEKPKILTPLAWMNKVYGKEHSQHIEEERGDLYSHLVMMGGYGEYVAKKTKEFYK